MTNTVEDGNLSKSNRVALVRQYSDIDLTFFARTSTDGDVFKKTDAAAVKQSLKSLLLTNKFEKPYKPAFGGNLSGLLFELADADTGSEIASRIKSTVSRFEPRVKILKLNVVSKPDTNSVEIRLEFRVVATGLVDSLKLVLGSVVDCTPEFLAAPPPKPFLGNVLLTESLDTIIAEFGGAPITLLYDDETDIYPDD